MRACEHDAEIPCSTATEGCCQELPIGVGRPARAGITRGTLELPTCSVSVLVTQTEAGAHVVSALLWTKADEAPRVETFRRGTRRAAWEAFAAWVAGVIS